MEDVVPVIVKAVREYFCEDRKLCWSLFVHNSRQTVLRILALRVNPLISYLSLPIKGYVKILVNKIMALGRNYLSLEAVLFTV